MGRRTLSVTTGQCAGTTLAYVARGSAKAAAEIRTARILYSAPPIWGYKSCALFVLQYMQSIHQVTWEAVVCKICSASILYGLCSILYGRKKRIRFLAILAPVLAAH